MELKESQIFYLNKGKELIIFLINNFTAICSYTLADYLYPLIEQQKADSIWIDLSKCTYIDSTAIGTFIKSHKLMKEKNKKLYICNLSKEIEPIFKQMRLHNILNICTNEILLNIEKEIDKNVPIKEKQFLTEQFILDAHHNLIEKIPSLLPRYESLFKILEQQIKDKKN